MQHIVASERRVKFPSPRDSILGIVGGHRSGALHSRNASNLRSVYDFHVALDNSIPTMKNRELPELGTCFTFSEAVSAGVLSQDAAAECRTLLSKEGHEAGASQGSELAAGDVLSIWDLCRLASRPDFVFSNANPEGDAAGVVIGGSTSDAHSSDLNQGGEDYEQAFSRQVSGVSCVSGMMTKTCEEATVIEGEWELGKCDGLDSAQNPQVQLQAHHLTWMGVDLVAEGPCGKTVQMLVLRNCRWGLRRPRIAVMLNVGDSELHTT